MEGMIIESRTQTPEQIAEVLKQSGYEAVVTTTGADGAETTTTLPAEPPAAPAGEEEKPKDETKPEETVVDPEQVEKPAEVAKPDEKVAKDPEDKDGGEKKTSGIQRLKQQRQALADKLAAATAEIETLKAGATAPAKPEPAVDVKEDDQPKPKPKYEDFSDSDDQYQAHMDATLDWRDSEKERLQKIADRKKQATEAVTQTQNSVAETERLIKAQWESQAAVERAEHEDFDAVIPTLKVTFPMQVALQAYDRGAGIAYYLATHPEEAAELVKKSTLPEKYTPLDITRAQRVVTREYDRIEGLLTQAEEQEEATTQVETPAKPAEATPPKAQATPPAAAAPPAKPASQPPPKKVIKPPTYAEGNPGAAGQRLKEMSPEDIRAMHPDEYRKRSDAGEWN